MIGAMIFLVWLLLGPVLARLFGAVIDRTNPPE